MITPGWYVFPFDSDTPLAGPFDTREEADAFEAENTQTEVSYVNRPPVPVVSRVTVGNNPRTWFHWLTR